MSRGGFDPDLLERVTDGDRALADELVRMLTSELPQHRRDIVAAVAEADLARVAQLAHKLSGGAAYCGATGLKAASDALDVAASNNDVESVLRRSEQLGKEIDRLLAGPTSTS